MKAILVLVLGLLGSSAMATPGDVGCSGVDGKGQRVDLLLGHDSFDDNGPSLIEIRAGGKVVFTSSDVTTEMVNVGTKEAPFINTQYTASDEESTATVRLPEQDGESDDFTVILNVITDSGLFRATELELTCRR